MPSYVFTKCSLVWDESDHTAPPWRVGTPANLRREVEASLRQLQVERIDLYQTHWPADGTPLEVYWQTLLDLKRKVRFALWVCPTIMPRNSRSPNGSATSIRCR